MHAYGKRLTGFHVQHLFDVNLQNKYLFYVLYLGLVQGILAHDHCRQIRSGYTSPCIRALWLASRASTLVLYNKCPLFSVIQPRFVLPRWFLALSSPFWEFLDCNEIVNVKSFKNPCWEPKQLVLPISLSVESHIIRLLSIRYGNLIFTGDLT